MSLIRAAAMIKMAHQNRGMAWLLRDFPKRFSTETVQDGAAHQSPQTPFSGHDSFLQNPSTGLVYGRLLGITKHTTKTDIISLLEGCNLSLDDIKVIYAPNYMPRSMMIQFPSQQAHEAAIRSINKRGRLYRLDKADRSEWDASAPYDGKAILLQGIPSNALFDDVERFLYGCQYDSSSIQLFSRQAFPDPVRMALVRFPSQALAMHAFITKNRGFCLNNQILVQLLH